MQDNGAAPQTQHRWVLRQAFVDDTSGRVWGERDESLHGGPTRAVGCTKQQVGRRGPYLCVGESHNGSPADWKPRSHVPWPDRGEQEDIERALKREGRRWCSCVEPWSGCGGYPRTFWAVARFLPVWPIMCVAFLSVDVCFMSRPYDQLPKSHDAKGLQGLASAMRNSKINDRDCTRGRIGRQ